MRTNDEDIPNTPDYAFERKSRRIAKYAGSKKDTHHILDRIEHLTLQGETTHSILLRLQPPARAPRIIDNGANGWFIEELG